MKSINVLAVSALFLIIGAAGLRAEAEPRSIRVTGEGKIEAEPDQAVFRFGIQTENVKLEEAKNENTRRTKALVKSLTHSGIANKDIQTTNVQINPVYRYDRGKRTFTHYSARKDFTVTINDLESYGKILNAAVEAGVENVGGLQFQSSKLEQLKSQARKMAAVNAREKAEELAAVFDQKIGKPLSIHENIHFDKPVPMLRGMEMMAMKAPDAPEDQLSPGEITIRATVSVEFELK